MAIFTYFPIFLHLSPNRPLFTNKVVRTLIFFSDEKTKDIMTVNKLSERKVIGSFVPARIIEIAQLKDML